jgi:hypothetical protein
MSSGRVNRKASVGRDSEKGASREGSGEPIRAIRLRVETQISQPQNSGSVSRTGGTDMNLLLIAAVVFGLVAEGPIPDFSGIWKQSNEQSSPKRTGDVTLRIAHRDPELVVETTSKGLIARHALQRYTTDGKESTAAGP